MTLGIAAALGEMAQMRDSDLKRRQPRERLSRAIGMIDGLLERLERLNLDDRSELPERSEHQLRLLLTVIPPELRPPARVRQPVRELIEELYRAQDSLLAQRCRPELLELRNSEEAELPDSA